MRRVLVERDRAAADLSVGSVHDLRVAIRRCRTLASGFMEMDGAPAWKKMRKQGGRLFRRLGELRDTQVMLGWVQALGAPSDPVRRKMVARLSARERELKIAARDALAEFDRERWGRWIERLDRRCRLLRPDGLAFEQLAVERWNDAHALHCRARRTRSRVAYHSLRIGIKRFRYTVENFLPRRHAAWGKTLKKLQDLLGEVHDLDVLWVLLQKAELSVSDRSRWRRKIEAARRERLDAYGARIGANPSRWEKWRAELPCGSRLRATATAKLAAWGSYLGADLRQPQRIARLCAQLFNGLARAGAGPTFADPENAATLRTAALLHHVGRSRRRKGHHKAAREMIAALPPPFGSTADDMARVGAIVRYQRGAEPSLSHPEFRALTPADRRLVRALAGVLRLALALDQPPPIPITAVSVEAADAALLVRAEGYREDRFRAGAVGAMKRLLETSLGRPVIVLPRRASGATRGRTA